MIEEPCKDFEVGDEAGATEMWFGTHVGERFDSLPEGYRRRMLSIYRKESTQGAPSSKVCNIRHMVPSILLNQFPVRQSQGTLR